MPQRGDTTQAIRIQLRTTLGMIECDLYRRAAPATVENFVRYIENGYWTGGIFHRTVTLGNQPDKADSVKIQVIQGAVGDIYRQYALPPIELETTEQTGLKHLDGTLSMARDEPNTAQYEFFMCIGDQPALNFGGARNPDGQGFAAFGRVVKGMDVVKKIQQSKAAGQTLTPPILIMGMWRK
jgi:peptidyl-prolyl cis-trans isomerase A (cyclophilin A)